MMTEESKKRRVERFLKKEVVDNLIPLIKEIRKVYIARYSFSTLNCNLIKYAH